MTALFDQGPPPPCPAPFNMAAHVLARAATLADTPALEVLDMARPAQCWSYGDLDRAVRGTATGLKDMGLQPGQRLLMRLDNSVDFPILFLAALAVDVVPVPTSAALTEPEVARIINDLTPALIVRDAGVACPPAPPCPVLPAARLHALRALPAAEIRLGDPGRLGYVIYTSGTAGQPRAVCHAHRTIWARRMMLGGWEGLAQGDRLLHAGAFNWTYTLGTGLMDPWQVGATALIPAPGTRSTDLFALLSRHKASIFAAAPGVFRQMLHGAPAPALPALRHGLSAGEKLPEITRKAWKQATGTAIYEAYGLSECSTFVSAAPGREAPPGATGRPQPGRRVAVLDGQGVPVAHEQPGTLAVSRRDPGLMLGYWNAPEETAARFAGEWFLTGDTARMAPDGTITYLGREDDMMNAGGYRVSPLEVERVLDHHPGIHQCAAVEVAVKADATVIALFYTAERALDEGALKGYAKERLARYKVPRILRHVPTLPRGLNGKLLRRTLRREFEASHDDD